MANKKFITGVVIVFLLAIVLIIAFTLSIFKNKPKINYSEDIAEVITSSNEMKLELTQKPQDVFIGSKNAPIQIISYDSYSCGYCGMFFTKVFPKLEAKYIKTGKVLFIHRDFPLDIQALTASKLIKCYAKSNNNAKTFTLITAIYEAQRDWVGMEDYTEKLTQILEFAGFPSKKAEECLKDEDLETIILEERLKASKILKINATPTFFINGEKLNKNYSYESFEIEIEALLKQEK
jgi:protein-disulfide isomerase